MYDNANFFNFLKRKKEKNIVQRSTTRMAIDTQLDYKCNMLKELGSYYTHRVEVSLSTCLGGRQSLRYAQWIGRRNGVVRALI